MLTDEMQTLITDHNAGMVATINDDGSPSVSPKATFVIPDQTTLAFGAIRSPGTLANLRKRPAVEVCFIDVLTRRAVRVTGSGRIVAKSDPAMGAAFEARWADYLAYMSCFVVIDVTRAEMILSPAYDIGHTADDLRRSNLARLAAL